MHRLDSRLVVCLGLLVAVGCGSSGGGTFAPIQSAGAAGSLCVPDTHNEGCMLGGNARMRCDGATSVWTQL
ncbi:MAG: hypothetical protein RIT45_12 [Pseudomonadota bacterium]|jgi:hypothetical protein